MGAIAEGAIAVAKAAPPQLLSIAALWENPANIAAPPPRGLIDHLAAQAGGDKRAWIRINLGNTYALTRTRRNGGTVTRNALVGVVVFNRAKRIKVLAGPPTFNFIALAGEAAEFETTMSAGLVELRRVLGLGNWVGAFDQTAILRPEVMSALIGAGFVPESGIPNYYTCRSAEETEEAECQ